MSRHIKYLSNLGHKIIDATEVDSRKFDDDQKCETCQQEEATHVCGDLTEDVFVCPTCLPIWHENREEKGIFSEMAYHSLSRSEDVFLNIPNRHTVVSRRLMHDILEELFDTPGIIETCIDFQNWKFKPYYLQIDLILDKEGYIIRGVSLDMARPDDVLVNKLWKQRRLLVHFGKVGDGMNILVGFTDIPIPKVDRAFSDRIEPPMRIAFCK